MTSQYQPLSAMCIDDSMIDLKLNHRVLSRLESFETILQFPSALEALDRLQKAYQANDGWPDVIFLDVNMPMMDGFEFLQASADAFGRDFDNRVVVMLSSSLNPRDRDRAERFSAVRAFLYKPITPADAQSIAEDILRMNTGHAGHAKTG